METGYSFSTSCETGGIKIDIAIETTKEMAMSEVLQKYAALSHEAYLRLARDVSGDKR
jgi:hypothetical protein